MTIKAIVTGFCLLALTGCAQADAPGGNDAALQTMLDKAAIEEMVTRYYANLGKDDAHAFDDYFTEDAVFDVNGIVANGRAEISSIYDGLGADETSATAPAGVFHMVLSNPVIDISGDTATANFIWTGVLNPSIDERPVIAEQGREYDKLVKVDGKWLFTHRVVVADSALPESMKATYTPRLDFSFE